MGNLSRQELEPEEHVGRVAWMARSDPVPPHFFYAKQSLLLATN